MSIEVIIWYDHVATCDTLADRQAEMRAIFDPPEPEGTTDKR